MTKTLTIITPAYNEELVIGDFCDAVIRILEPLKDRYNYSILVVIDKCPDKTFQIVRNLGRSNQRIKGLQMSSRFGHQAALLAGIDHTESDLLIMMDCDFQHPPELIPRLLEEHAKGADIVFTVKADYSSISWWRRAAARMFYRTLNSLSEIPIRAHSSDYRLISGRVAHIFRTQLRERTLFLRGLLSWIGFPSATIEFDVAKRQAGHSKYTLRQMLGLALYGVLSFSKRPLRLATITGFVFSVLGFLYGLYIVLGYLVWEGALPPGWATLAVLVSILSGIQLLCLGVIGEYVGAIFNEVKARPHYIVEERVNL
jgi:glycosyltransferase involved in cell wall biosynthesis